jgi:acyl-ACP thioesterase
MTGRGAAAGGSPRPRGGGIPEGRIGLRVRRGDVDLYDHLHNTTYMDWLMEAVPDGLYRDSEPERMGIRFFGEARLGDEVAFLSQKSGNGWLHDVVRESDGNLLVRGYSEWRKREGKVPA